MIIKIHYGNINIKAREDIEFFAENVKPMVVQTPICLYCDSWFHIISDCVLFLSVIETL